MKHSIKSVANSFVPFKKSQQTIAIVGSTNPRLNAMARDSQLTIRNTLRKKYINVYIHIVNDFASLESLVAKKPDLVILGVKLILTQPEQGYEASPKVWLSDYLTQHGIAHTGSSTTALKIEFDKQDAKQCVIDAGLASPKYFTVRIGESFARHNLNFPLFVKPSNRGDSKGVDEQSVVHTDAQLKHKLHNIHYDYESDALVEEYLSGREFSVAVIGTSGQGFLTAMPIEISTEPDSNGNRYLSETVKEADSETVSVVADQRLKASLQKLAIGVFGALGSRDYGRIDMRLDAQGNPSFIEANLMPGLSTHGYMARCLSMNVGTTYDNMIYEIVSLGLERITIIQPLTIPAPDFA